MATTPPPTSVLLPTVRWTDACDEVAAQLNEDDELLVVADSPADPVAGRDLPDGVRVVLAGEPVGCSGKANAIAAGTEAAENDRLVWTDDDFHHPPDWLATLHDDYAAHGPVTELPFFVGADPLARLLEPLYALGGTLGVYLGGYAWGGAVVFERSDLHPDEAGLLRDLRRTVSDDGLLSERVDVTPVRRVRRVTVGGDYRTTLERHVRFSKIVGRHSPGGTAANLALALVLAVVCLLAPLPAALFATAATTAAYAFVGVRRPTALLAYPAVLAGPALFGYALVRRTFVWGGRRYRWRSTFDVEVCDRVDGAGGVDGSEEPGGADRSDRPGDAERGLK
ncbi:glycosyltransferase family 2 protein [Candidatus Halobonum tyrrellensis]|uniref:Glycosyl transferase family protein n=1 Tax=Candidatus Halobonum tyrrellensis G22 TaxID=1324957 RepID=V4HIB2_9EURY|nr:glycosyltransferase [Candidatus Halobonum tyrrellensis]ESP89503.1 glycosyl transferase family protein [Candidatus Halobonum tyrrellensis G22]